MCRPGGSPCPALRHLGLLRTPLGLRAHSSGHFPLLAGSQGYTFIYFFQVLQLQIKTNKNSSLYLLSFNLCKSHRQGGLPLLLFSMIVEESHADRLSNSPRSQYLKWQRRDFSAILSNQKSILYVLSLSNFQGGGSYGCGHIIRYQGPQGKQQLYILHPIFILQDICTH